MNNKLEIYVKTSALGTTGIHWRSIVSEESQPREKPSLIQSQLIKGNNSQFAIVNDLIDEVKPSLLIFRDQDKNKLLLEVTGIESPQRSDKLGRKVLNAIVWIADDLKDNEDIFRKIAYSAIQSILDKDLTFSKMIEESIDFFDLEEFRVRLDKIHEFIQQLEPVNCLESNDVEYYQKYQIEVKSTESLKKLAEEIRNNPLPKDWIISDGSTKKDGVLVVVTESLEIRTILHKAGVWRGFASNVEEPQSDQNVEEPQSDQKKTQILPSIEPPEEEKSPIPPPLNQKLRLMILLVSATITITLILVSLKLMFQPQQTPQPQTQEQQILQPQTQPTHIP